VVAVVMGNHRIPELEVLAVVGLVLQMELHLGFLEHLILEVAVAVLTQ
jgi:hypothetical protein